MNPIPWITTFATLSIAALSFSLIGTFWLPMLGGALALLILIKLVR
jgi:hypothetical protein